VTWAWLAEWRDEKQMTELRRLVSEPPRDQLARREREQVRTGGHARLRPSTQQRDAAAQLVALMGGLQEA
jgi:hypothetical protein